MLIWNKILFMNTSVYENYVRQVAREGSLTKAAEKIGISQPALSSGLATLEKKLGFRIFDRSLTPVALTEEGSIYFDYIRRKNALTEDFETRIKVCKSSRDRQVSIGAPVVYSESIVSKAVCTLLQNHPDYSVSIRTASLNRLIDAASDGKLDCFVSTSEDIPGEFTKEEIKQEQIYLCIPKDREINAGLARYEKENLPLSDLSLLKDEEFILLEEDQPIRILLDTCLVEQQISLKSRVTVNQVATAVNLASLGLGCCFASGDALFQPSVREKLCIYHLSHPVFRRPIYAVSHREFYQTRACRDLISILVNGS